MDNTRKRRREAREEAKRAKRQTEPPQTSQPEQPSGGQHERQQKDERAALRADIAQGQSTVSQPLTSGIGLTVGLNSTTRALETCQPTADTANTSPFALLVLTSCFPPALTAHFIYFSHYLRLPLLTLHPAITTEQLAHCLSPELTSLLVLGLHHDSSPSLLASLLPMARVLHVGWLDGQGGYEQLRIDRVERSEERVAREEAKRKVREEAVRAARPLSPKSIAAAVFMQKQKDKEATDAAAKQASADSRSMPDINFEALTRPAAHT